MQLFKKLSWYFKIEWKRYLGAIIILIIISILQLIPPKLLGMLVDLIVKDEICTKTALYWIGIISVTAIIIYILRYIWRILLFGAAYNLAIKLRSKIYFYLNQQNKEFYLKNRTGDIMAKATNDVDKIVFAAGEGVLTLVDSIVMGGSVLIMMSTQISLKLTLLSLLPLPIMAVIIIKYGKELHYYFHKSQEAFSKLNNQTQESLTSIRMIRAFGLEKHLFKKFTKIAKKTEKKNIDVAKIDAKFDPTIHFAISFSNLIAIIAGGNLIWTEEITIGQLTSFIMYLGLTVWPILALAWMFNIMERGDAAWERIQCIFNIKHKIPKKTKNPIQKKGILNIKINNFTYKNRTILKNINIKIKPGQIIGICGPTGSGKSTILDLIQNNFSSYSGQITFNNIPISQINPYIWRKRLTVVNQKTFLFSDSILNNICLGKKNTSLKEIENVASLVHIHHEIIKFPQGYNTKIGEKGISLSGGQKQRIAIARALLLNTEILILDDALSAVDIETEYKILKNLNTLQYKKQTKIIISNHLPILAKSDEILVINKGTIDSRGGHIQLLKNNTWYKNMYNYQILK
ncbi:ABC transporter transmembrane domain-containing protein [Buchnera aphidicola (Mollitrichosiphum nigrofasciatum)]|uniref:ABC transporter transmembrane domain-containing protein n=1 Tax=Buchnera aphidicola TaxID=9 RepID=UPI0031B86BB9